MMLMRFPLRSVFNPALGFLIAFCLPLGFLSIVGIAGAILYLLINWRNDSYIDWQRFQALLPYLSISFIAAALSPEPSISLLRATGFIFSSSLALLIALSLNQNHAKSSLALAFLFGTSLLALSIIIEALFLSHRLPSGFFLQPALHNWAGACMALAFPLSLHFMASPGYRLAAVLASILLLAGTGAALSWVGTIGIITGGISYGLASSTKKRFLPITLALSLAVLAGAYSISLISERWLPDLAVRGFTLTRWQGVLQDRLTIFQKGLELGLKHPWFGWGWAHGKLNVATAGQPLIQQVNLIKLSESFDYWPWQAIKVAVKADQALSPDGTHTADLLSCQPLACSRLSQRLRDLPADTTSFTFSIWARAASGIATLALTIRDPIRDPTGEHGIVQLSSRQAKEHPFANFQLDETWQRLSLTAHINGSIPDGLLLSLYPGGYPQQNMPSAIYLWGAQFEQGLAPNLYSPIYDDGSGLNLNRLPHFHNLFVQTFFETGFLGLISLLGFLSYLWQVSQGSWGRLSRAALIGFLSTQFFDYAWAQTSIVMSFVLIVTLGIPLATRQGEHPQGTL